MDWLWPIYEEHIMRMCDRMGLDRESLQVGDLFMAVLGESTATLFVMEPVGDSIKFMGLGRWDLSDVPDLVSDPNTFIDTHFGGGKYKVNFHHKRHFVGTHNFRTYSEELWRNMEELIFED
jgi:hypothetical protein